MKKQEKFNECILRIKDEEILKKLSDLYLTRKQLMGWSKNSFLIYLIKIGLAQEEKNIRNVWELKNEQQTILDAIHEHTKRMNFFIKFSKPFIKKSYANTEVNQVILARMYNYLFDKMSFDDKAQFKEYMNEHYSKLPKDLLESKQKMLDYYDFEVEESEKQRCKFEEKMKANLSKNESEKLEKENKVADNSGIEKLNKNCANSDNFDAEI